METIKLTEYSHGAGCGCKISPKVLETILKTNIPQFTDKSLLVGNDSRDDAAVYNLGNGTSVISTTDFFMPIVDNPFTFGKIAATNAISDIYAMGGKPIMAIAIFGWPIEKLPPEVGQKVIDGGRSVCHAAGVTLAGGHSIDAPEPIFGLAVTGIIDTKKVKCNNTAKSGDILFLTKPLGVGILTTAQKKKILKKEHEGLAEKQMCQLNKIGESLSNIIGVHAMTDVTGFGLGGHLLEICQGSSLSAQIEFNALPLLPYVLDYIKLGSVPGGTLRNFDSYGEAIGDLSDIQKRIICDPQTSGGLLISVDIDSIDEVINIAKKEGIDLNPIGKMVDWDGKVVRIELN